jgi:gliding motility-associated lipoprotein GldH
MKNEMRINRLKTSVICILFFVLISSCDQNQVFEQNINFPDLTWNKDSVVTIQVDIKDTISAHNIYINVRNTSRYETQNLFLFVNTASPNGTVLRDTFECYLANDRGNWTGSGWGDMYENQFVYKKNIRFPISGTYTFKYIQAMRTNELKNISDIGLRIEKVEFR